MRIVVLTGAGVSAESGLGTFRDPDGLWRVHSLEDLATPEGFARNPALVWDFYNGRRRALREAEPNPAHRALAQLEAALDAAGGALTLVTQNVDDLHERGGSRRVLHMHGELKRSRCADCGDAGADEDDLGPDRLCAACGARGRLRPDVVWFGETPIGLDAVAAALARADLFVSMGTSGAVYPAAGFVDMARAMGVATMELNLQPSDNAHLFEAARYGPAGEVAPAWVTEIIGALPGAH